MSQARVDSAPWFVLTPSGPNPSKQPPVDGSYSGMPRLFSPKTRAGPGPPGASIPSLPSACTPPGTRLGVHDAAKVLLKPAAPVHGVIAGGVARAILEAAGVHDVLAKSLGSANAINVSRATIAGLKGLRRPDDVATLEAGDRRPGDVDRVGRARATWRARSGTLPPLRGSPGRRSPASRVCAVRMTSPSAVSRPKRSHR